MKNIITFALAAGLAGSMIAHAQQNPQPQPQASQKMEIPCPPVAPKQPGKGIRFHFPRVIQQQIDKQGAKISSTIGIDVPKITPQELAKQMEQKPCSPAVVTPPQK